MGFGAKVEAGGVAAGPGAGDDGAEIGDASYGRLQSGVVAAVVDANVGAAFVGGKFDFEAGVAGGGVQDDVSATFERNVAAQGNGVDGDEGVGAGQFGKLEDEEADGAHAEYCDGIADADVAVADCAEGEIGGVEADGGLPGDAVREFAGAFCGPDVLLPEGAVRKNGFAEAEVFHAGTDFDDLADAHVAQPVGVSDHLAFLGEQVEVAIVVAAMAGVALEHGHFGAVFGGAEAAADANLIWGEGLAFVVAEGDFFAGGGNQFCGHLVSPGGVKLSLQCRESCHRT